MNFKALFCSLINELIFALGAASNCRIASLWLTSNLLKSQPLAAILPSPIIGVVVVARFIAPPPSSSVVKKQKASASFGLVLTTWLEI